MKLFIVFLLLVCSVFGGMIKFDHDGSPFEAISYPDTNSVTFEWNVTKPLFDELTAISLACTQTKSNFVPILNEPVFTYQVVCWKMDCR